MSVDIELQESMYILKNKRIEINDLQQRQKKQRVALTNYVVLLLRKKKKQLN